MNLHRTAAFAESDEEEDPQFDALDKKYNSYVFITVSFVHFTDLLMIMVEVKVVGALMMRIGLNADCRMDDIDK